MSSLLQGWWQTARPAAEWGIIPSSLSYIGRSFGQFLGLGLGPTPFSKQRGLARRTSPSGQGTHTHHCCGTCMYLVLWPGQHRQYGTQSHPPQQPPRPPAGTGDRGSSLQCWGQEARQAQTVSSTGCWMSVLERTAGLPQPRAGAQIYLHLVTSTFDALPPPTSDSRAPPAACCRCT